MSLFNKDVSENLCLKEIEKFVYFLNDTFTVAYLSKPFNFISEKIFNNLNFRNFIEIYEINLEKINYYFSNATYNFKFEDKKNISKLFFNENKYGFLFLIEYVYNIFYHLELDKIKYEEIVNCPWVKARNFIEIKNIIEKICTYKNMNFKKFKKK